MLLIFEFVYEFDEFMGFLINLLTFWIYYVKKDNKINTLEDKES